MGIFNELKSLQEITNDINSKEKDARIKEFQTYIEPIYKNMKVIVDEIVGFFDEELTKLDNDEFKIENILDDIEKFRHKGRSTRIEIRESIKHTNLFNESKELKLFAIGIMSILKGSVDIYGLERRETLESTFPHSNIDYYDLLGGVVTEDTKLESLYWNGRHVLMNVTASLRAYRYDEESFKRSREEFEKETDKLRREELIRGLEITEERYKNKDHKGQLKHDINYQIEQIFKAWEIVAVAYTILKDDYDI